MWIITTSVLAALITTPVVAENNWLTVYGLINVSLDAVDKESSGDDEWQVNSNSSRFGIKGKGVAGDGLETFYGLEWQVEVDDNEVENIKHRNQFIGIRGRFGELLIGRHDTPFKKSIMEVALFEDLIGDHKSLVSQRRDNILA